ncbi:hypothetical protein K1719_010955 [Acacia pycnantha]|nr:hypothetical protein K1719_010955 [Acacia pycnantha]
MQQEDLNAKLLSNFTSHMNFNTSQVEFSTLSVRSAKSNPVQDLAESRRLLCDSKLYPQKSASDLGLIAFSALVFGLVDRKCQYCRKAIRFKSGRFGRTILKKSLH